MSWIGPGTPSASSAVSANAISLKSATLVTARYTVAMTFSSKLFHSLNCFLFIAFFGISYYLCVSVLICKASAETCSFVKRDRCLWSCWVTAVFSTPIVCYWWGSYWKEHRRQTWARARLTVLEALVKSPVNKWLVSLWPAVSHLLFAVGWSKGALMNMFRYGLHSGAMGSVTVTPAVTVLWSIHICMLPLGHTQLFCVQLKCIAVFWK